LPARRQFGSHALLVNPYDPESVGAAIARALEMPRAERRQRHAALYEALLHNDISEWGDKFLAALSPAGFGDSAEAKQAYSAAGITSAA
jgi:trehalose 6-phosphate synthase